MTETPPPTLAQHPRTALDRDQACVFVLSCATVALDLFEANHQVPTMNEVLDAVRERVPVSAELLKKMTPLDLANTEQVLSRLLRESLKLH